MTESILSFSDAALAHVQQKISAKHGAVGFRMAIKETGCTGLMYVPEIIEAVNEGDVHEHVRGVDVYIAADAVDAIKGTTVDYVDMSLGQKQLAFDNPNADSLCGCGESFNLKKNDGQDEV
ncbi:MAG: iron-sulfur cluster assembly accessory protein [Coxiellaceae bacterium]|nr:iron-sulfur cluster assembly accessory protein [Coxiellaceae bacterium]